MNEKQSGHTWKNEVLVHEETRKEIAEVIEAPLLADDLFADGRKSNDVEVSVYKLLARGSV